MIRISILFILIGGLGQWSFSQSEFLLRGESACEGGLGLSTNREGNGLNISAGYSYRGFIDASLLYTKANGGNVQGGVFSPSITFYLAKQEDAENLPTLALSFGTSHYVSKTTETVFVPDTVILTWRSYERVTEMTINTLNLELAAERRIGYWNVLFFQPAIGAGLSMKKAGWEFKLLAGVSIGMRIVQGPLLIFTPSIERQSDLTTFVITFNTVF